MKITVRFHGLLGKLCPGEHVVEANNAYEALRIVCRNNEKKLTRKNGHQFSCFCKQVKSEDQLFQRGLTNEIDVMPSFAPSGGGTAKSAWIQTAIVVVVAIILTAVCAVIPGAQAAIPLIWKGAALTIAGIWAGALAQHLQGKKKPDQNETQQNYAFGMNGNTTKVGTAIPIGYGRYRVYGQLLSWATQAEIGETIKKKRFLRRSKTIIDSSGGVDISNGTVTTW